MDSFELISARELKVLHQYRSRFWYALVLALGSVLACFYYMARCHALESVLSEVKSLQTQSRLLQEEQIHVNAVLRQGLENQKQMADSITSVGEYLSTREALQEKNRTMLSERGKKK